MKRLGTYLAAGLLVAFGAGCGDSSGSAGDVVASDTSGASDTTATAGGPNASAKLDGAAAGMASEPVADLAKALTVGTVSGDGGGVVIDGAWYGKFKPGHNTTAVMIRAKNQGNTARCFVEATIAFKGAGGGTLHTEAEHVQGSVAASSSGGSISDTCLFPGEVGYVLGTIAEADAPYATTVGVDITLSQLAGVPLGVEASVAATSYAIGADGKLTVTFTNTGQVSIDTIAPISVFLDANGDPLYFGGISGGAETVAPGATVDAGPTSVNWRGTSSSIWFHIDFEPTP